MDRVISLLAALVGLIALGGAILVHTNADNARYQLASDIAQLKTSVSLLGHEPAPSIPPITIASSEPPPASAEASSTDEATARALQAMQDRIAALEQQTQQQASALGEAESKLAAAESRLSAMPSSAPMVDIATAAPAPLTSAEPSAPLSAPATATASSSVQPAAITADGPTKDCIPIGTRFMAAGGDSFPICKTRTVVKVAAVTDGLATITGPGDVTVGATVALNQGCTVTVFSADNSGYAEMRVSCQ